MISKDYNSKCLSAFRKRQKMTQKEFAEHIRVSDKTVFFLLGEVIESGETEKLFSVPQDKRTEDYITGRFG